MVHQPVLLSFVILVVLNVAICYRLTISDLEAAPSHHFQQGGGKEYASGESSSHGEKGDKGYAGHHELEKGAKGHHDKDNQKKHYAEEGGHKKGYNHRDGYYGEQHKGENGKKGYHYADKGSYAKGHSTKGHHNIHKLNEYKKDTDFFDEDHDEGHKEKHGGYEVAKGASAGAHNSGGHFKKVYLDGDFGVAGKFAKGSHYFDESGHKKAQGHDGHYANAAEFGKKGGHDQFKGFGFSHLTHH